MATIDLTKQYYHSEDCRQEGCPSHEAKFTYQSTSDAYLFEMGDGRHVRFERGELEAFLTLLAQMSKRNACCVNINDYANKK